MLENYIKIAWRNLWRNKFFSLINISGLALGIACSLLILLWVQSEFSTDAFHKNDKQLYTVIERSYLDHKVVGSYNTPGVLAAEVKKVIPEVQYATQIGFDNKLTFQVGEKIIKLAGSFAGADFFKMFSYKILQGSPETALSSPVSIAISKKMAEDFYGSTQAAIGKTIKCENKDNFTVMAVFDNMPANSSMKVEYLINWDNFLKENAWAKSWGNGGPLTDIQLRPDANPALVDKKLTHFLDAYNKEQKKGTLTIELGIQKFSEGYLNDHFTNGKIDGGRIEYVKLFSIVAVFVLLIACINFMNLTTARSVKRAREIGVRKVVGAVRSALIGQFIGETVLLTSVATAVSLLLIVLLLPLFNQITQKQITLPFGKPTFWIELMILVVITGFLAGSYPALFLSSFNPIKVLKGTAKVGIGAAWFRKGLVVFQFVLSIVLIIGTIIVSKQINFVQSKNLGYDRENLVYIPMEGDLAMKYNIFKNEALKALGIAAVSRTSDLPTDIQNGTTGVQWEGKDPAISIQFTQASVGYDFVKTLKLKLLNGRDFSSQFLTDTAGYVINEAALARIGYKDPIGKPLTFWGRKGKIIGVVKDFHFNSLREQIKPIIFRYGEKDMNGGLLIRTRPGKIKEAMATLEQLCRQLNPSFPFNYYFSDQEYQKLYNNEQIVDKLANAFAFLAIFISCLGLLGLAMFTAEQRVKEIGIRKVLGASVGSLFALLSGEFIVLVVIALLIASPLAWFAMTKWLTNFAYRTPIQWWVFLLAAALAIIITLITISFQSVKAALVNPVNSLRSE